MIDSFDPENLSRFSVLELVDPKSCRILYAGPYEVSADAGKNSSLAWFYAIQVGTTGSVEVCNKGIYSSSENVIKERTDSQNRKSKEL